MRARRNALTGEERARDARVICGKLADALSGADAQERAGDPPVVAVYLASPREIDITPFILDMLEKGVPLAAPRWNGKAYDLAGLKSLSARDLRHGPMGILEPAQPVTVPPEKVDVWIVPGLAFTAEGARLGYGGGWYDRLLAASDARALKIGVAHAFQIVGHLPVEPHDIRLDRIVTR